MPVQLNDNVRAGIRATIASAIPVLILTGVIDVTSDEVAIIMLFVTNSLDTMFLMFKKGQQAETVTTKTTIEKTEPVVEETK